ncbi:RES family NAD+ phosphorylase [Polaribacter ponticola]|uniref:RES family NAD+ phosphorylase n=1 Tax=Polaribacter ponticola TaxID=2978475 RepID=A0ABT5S9Y0_9FLAO|nr:RES family NAD+ phosphorylase [Polaribacter sp. MSW5]MDD7914903.1 RES family NAD+ phosphorylase [Polaribacter sp. MSW5]
MNCCVNCFNSIYLKSIIDSYNKKGKCDFCKSDNVSIYLAKELADYFRNIFSLYDIDSKSKLDISASIKKNFNLTTDLVVDNKFLFKSIFIDEIEDFNHLFENQVSSNILQEETKIHNIWNDFKKEIKFANRYFASNSLNFEIFKSIIQSSLIRDINVDETFYRSRISDKIGFDKNNMGNPPKPELATAGRANPKGISYLYIANSLETALYETRSTIFDYVTIGEFEVKKELKVISFRNIETDPIYWSEREDIKSYIEYLPFIYTLQKELSLPIRKKDKTLDYIPTQYICEYIKSLGFDGVEYQSSLFAEGYNLAIFNPDKLECIATKVYEIENIKLHHKLLDNS